MNKKMKLNNLEKFKEKSLNHHGIIGFTNTCKRLGRKMGYRKFIDSLLGIYP